jgi:hypothetical protein
LQDPLPSTTGKNPKEQNHDELRNQQQHHVNPLRSQPADEYVSKPPLAAPVLPFPMNVNAPEPDTPQSNYLSFETGPKVHRRRATLPSMVLSPADAAALKKMWSTADLQAVSPSIQSVGMSMPSPVIGMAVTSGSNPNRRSRSAGALHDLSRMQEETIGVRRRSSEIRFWRTSQKALQENERPVSISSEGRSEKSSEKSSSSSIQPSATDVSDALAETGSSVHEDQVHAFDFGSMSTEQNSTDKHISIVESRLSQLEFNMQHLSLSLQEVSQQNNRQTIILDRAPREHQSQPSLNGGHLGLPANPKDPVFPLQRSTSSGRYTQKFLAPMGSPSTPKGSFLSSPSSYDPSSPRMLAHGPAQTTRPSTSQATPQGPQTAAHGPNVPPMYDDHLAPLYNALRYEREVRKALEMQVFELRRDVLELGKVVTQLRGTQGYPTPSPDPALREESVPAEKSRFSGYDSDDEGKGMAERWATPREENAPTTWGYHSDGEMF